MCAFVVLDDVVTQCGEEFKPASRPRINIHTTCAFAVFSSMLLREYRFRSAGRLILVFVCALCSSY